MDHDILTDLGVGYVLQADVFINAADIHNGHQRAEPRNAMPSYMRPSTRAVSAMDAFLPLWEPSGPR